MEKQILVFLFVEDVFEFVQVELDATTIFGAFDIVGIVETVL